MADLLKQLPMSENQLQELINKLQDVKKGYTTLHDVAGVSKAELQDFLENKAGLSPDEEAQGTPLAAAVSIAYHC